MQPQRIQRKRVKGFRLPENTVCVNRGTKWGNPFVVGKDGTRKEVITNYRQWLLNQPDLLAKIPMLKGKTLACFCPDHEPCHADVLLELANN